MPTLPDKLTEALIVDCANRLGASKVPIDAIQAAWKAQTESDFCMFHVPTNQSHWRPPNHQSRLIESPGSPPALLAKSHKLGAVPPMRYSGDFFKDYRHESPS